MYVEGKIRSRTYDDANGIKRYVNEIYADNLELLGSRRREEGGESNNNTSYDSYQTPSAPSAPIVPMNDDDDLPF